MGYPMNIGEAGQAAGVTAKMIRHYEALGLIPQAARTDAGYRQYTAREVATLRFIRQGRSMGFSMKQIEQLLGLWTDTNRESRDVNVLAREHIAELDRGWSHEDSLAPQRSGVDAAAHHIDERDVAERALVDREIDRHDRADRQRRLMSKDRLQRFSAHLPGGAHLTDEAVGSGLERDG